MLTDPKKKEKKETALKSNHLKDAPGVLESFLSIP